MSVLRVSVSSADCGLVITDVRRHQSFCVIWQPPGREEVGITTHLYNMTLGDSSLCDNECVEGECFQCRLWFGNYRRVAAILLRNMAAGA